MFLLTERELNLQKQSWDLAGSEPKTVTSKPLGPLAEEGKKNYIAALHGYQEIHVHFLF